MWRGDFLTLSMYRLGDSYDSSRFDNVGRSFEGRFYDGGGGGGGGEESGCGRGKEESGVGWMGG